MFEIDQRVVYPMHGAGTVKRIESLDPFETGAQDYYVIEIGDENMNITIPVDTAEELGVRPIVSEEVIDQMIDSLRGDMDEMNKNWNKRYQSNMEILKTGDIFEVAKVVKNLVLLNRKKGLSTGEKKMMTSSRDFLVSEVVLVKNCTESEALDMINKAIGSNIKAKKK